MSSRRGVRPVQASARPVLWVDLPSATDPSIAGGKAWNLQRLMRAGAPVPSGAAVTTSAFESFLAHDALGARLQAVTSAEIRDLVDAAPMPDDVAAALQAAARPLVAGGPVVVRSSAVGEDGSHASFAGQFDSVLHVSSLDGVERAVRRCWASLWSERAMSYRSARGLSPAGMGVVIQRQVRAAVAGVLFTRGPEATGENAPMVVEYTAGFGDALVSGAVDPGRIEISRRDWSIVERQALPDASRHPEVRALLTPRRLLDLGRLAVHVERELGAPQDLEWVVDESGALWIVQARPITTGPAVTDRVLWSNVNVSENFPAPISPLLYSIASTGYAHYFRNLGLAFGVSRRRLAAMDHALRGIIGVHGARMYYNLSNIHAVLRMAPFGEALAASFNRFVGADRMAVTPPEAHQFGTDRGRLTQSAEAVRIAACVTWQFARLGRRVAAFERQADRFSEATRPEALRARTLPQLSRDLMTFVAIRRDRWKNASLADAAAMVSYAVLERLPARAGAAPAAINGLLRSLPDVPSSRPPVELWELGRLIAGDQRLAALFRQPDRAATLARVRTDPAFRDFSAALDGYLDRWGFRSSAELMLTVPTLAEDPSPLVDLLREYAGDQGEPPAAQLARQAASRRRETRRLIGRLGWRRPLLAASLWRWLSWTQRAIAYRERARLKQARLYTRVRDIALAIGDRLVASRRLAHRDDVFWLTWQEIDEIADGRAMFPDGVRALVDLRRAEHARLSALQPDDTFELVPGAYLEAPVSPAAGVPAAAVAAGASDARDQTAAGPAAPITLSGTSACSGIASSRAAVLRDVTESARLTRGDVLVTRQTDPGWGPLFCLVSGLVIERGGMLSHGAIIAREFGLPCVVGVKDATRRIPHGAGVVVDGDRGECRVEARP